MSTAVILFTGGIWNNWHPCTFTIGDRQYSCVEQYMMHQKALLFRDEKMADAIMGTRDPRVIKRFGRQVAGFDEKVWDAHCEAVVETAVCAKFTQNRELLRQLVATDGQFAEASPRDAKWGIGISAKHHNANTPARWPGRNLLGNILTRVRDDLKRTYRD